MKKRTATQTQYNILRFDNMSLDLMPLHNKELDDNAYRLPLPDAAIPHGGAISTARKMYEALSDTKILLYNATNGALERKISL